MHALRADTAPPSLLQEVQQVATKYIVPPRVYDEESRNQDEAAEREKTRKNFDKLGRQQTGRGSLVEFVRYFWHTLEPNPQLIDGWPLEAICLHLEAVTFGDIKSLHRRRTRAARALACWQGRRHVW
jgi:hypothetical protein